MKPERCFLGGSVEIFGWVKPNHPGVTIINLEFTKPVSGDIIKEQVQTNSRGEYSFLFKNTDEAGIWKVKAQKAGTNIKKEAEFEVRQRIFLVYLCQEVKKESEETRDAYDSFRELVKNYPDFPEKDNIINDVGDLFQQLNEMETGLVSLENTVKQMNQVLSTIKEFPASAREELIEAGEKTNNAIEETRKQTREIKEVLKESEQEADWCYIWMAYYDLSNQLKFYNNFLADSLKGIAQNLLQAKLTQGLDPKLQSIIGKVVDKLTGSTKTPVGIANKIMGKMADLGKKVYNGLLENCTTYSGDAQGEYYAELIHDDMVFYTMYYQLSGEMELTFQKRKPGDPKVKLKGRYKGKVHNFKCSITMAPFASPDTIGPVYCLAATPLVSNHSFLLYLEGRAADDFIELKYTKTGRDFKLKSRAFYIMLSSAAYHLPIPGDFSFPLQNAEWFLTRVSKISNPNIEYFELPIEVQSDIPVAEKEFDRTLYLPETEKRVGVRVQMKLHLKICSPKCK
ncbi:MAG: hypothetical protein ACOC6P_00010 [Candidatus Aminicenantaceae bacterium]